MGTCGCDDCGEPQSCDLGESLNIEAVKLRVRDVPYPKLSAGGSSEDGPLTLRVRDPFDPSGEIVPANIPPATAQAATAQTAESRALSVAHKGPVSLLLNSITRAVLDSRARPGVASVLQPWVDALETKVMRIGKYSKSEVIYIPFSPPPALWDYKCKKCNWWRDGGCAMVEGEISPSGWCAVWIPPSNYRPLSWPKELVRGEW